MEYILKSILIISTSVVWIAIYRIRRTVKYRLVETLYYSCPIDNTNKTSSFSPQVRIDGVWLNIVYRLVNGRYTIMAEIHFSENNLDAQDAIILIQKFKSAGNYTIESNKKLESNQKSITVE